MRNNIFFAALVFVGGFIFGNLSSWLAIIPFSALIAFQLKMMPLKAFGIGFASTSLCWTIVAMYLNISNHSKMVEMISTIFMSVGTNNLYYITGIIGGITGGLGCWVGAAFRRYLSEINYLK